MPDYAAAARPALGYSAGPMFWGLLTAGLGLGVGQSRSITSGISTVHSLARRLAGRLVWTAREADGARGAPGRPRTFRPAEDGALLGPDDARLDLPDGAVVRLAHGTIV